MGLFDNINCKVALPVKEEEGSAFDLTRHEWENKEFQTKDLENALIDYEIREDGLWRKDVKYETEEVSEKENKHDFWNPAWRLKEVSSKWEKEKFTGYINFYDFMTDDDGDEDLWVEFRAHFVLGELQGIELEEWRKENNEERKRAKIRFREEIKARKELKNKLYFKVFCSPWNFVMKFAFRILRATINFFSSKIHKIESWLTF